MMRLALLPMLVVPLLLSAVTGAKFVGVPYRGSAPSLNDVIAGHVPMMVASVGIAAPQARAGFFIQPTEPSLARLPPRPPPVAAPRCAVAHAGAAHLRAPAAPGSAVRSLRRRANADTPAQRPQCLSLHADGPPHAPRPARRCRGRCHRQGLAGAGLGPRPHAVLPLPVQPIPLVRLPALVRHQLGTARREPLA